MSYKFTKYILSSSLILLSLHSYSQEYNNSNIQNYFKEISVEQGLSAANVNAIAKDSAGFIWIGTEYGLNRYDGNSIKVFLSSNTVKNSISSNSIFDIVTDKNGGIWVGTLVGLNKYQHLSEDFKFYTDTNTSNIYGDLDYDSISNRVWIAAGNGGLKYVDLESDSLINCSIDIKPIELKVWGDKLLIGTKDRGLVILDKNSYKILEIIATPLNSPVFSISIINDEIWVATAKDGILKIHENNITYFTSQNSGFKAEGALCLEEDKNGNLLIGTDGKGLFVYNHKQNKFYQIIKRPRPHSIQSNAIRAIFTDELKNIWLATYASGVNMHPYHNQSIKNYQNDYTSKNSLSNNFILAIEESISGELFIGTNRGSLNILNKGQFSKVKIPGDVALSLCEDSKGRLWIGTYQHGIFLYENNKLKNYADIINDSIFNTSSVWDITEGPEGNIWFATTHLLLKINVENFAYTIYQNKKDDPNSLTNNNVKSLFWDNQKNLWIGTLQGISIFSSEKNQFNSIEHFKVLSTKLITSITEINSKVYFGTYGDGIYIFDKKKEIMDSLSKESNGISHNVIVDLINDKKGNLWATTANGISKINTTTKKIENFSTADGFIGNTFNPRSCTILSSGHLSMGSTAGLSIFHPDSISSNTSAPQTLLTELKVLNNVISIDNKILHKPITFSTSFSLPPQSNSFSISYVGLNYDNQNKVIYKYILEGFDEEWRIVGNHTHAAYTNLRPGDYTFKVIASNGNNLWTQKPATVLITILPYWWQTPLAKTIFALLAIGIPILIIRIRTDVLSKQKKKLKQQVKERTKKLEKAYNQLATFNSELELKVKERTLKLEKSNGELDRFVYSASHDLSAPLKSISGLLYLAKIDDCNDTTFYLDKIENSIQKLEEVIKNLIQFSRNSRQEVKMEIIDFHKLKNNLQEDLIYSASIKNTIEFTHEVKGELELITDPVRLNTILSNFISNALKYRKEIETCKIHLSIFKKEDRIIVSIEDNGIGIETEYLDKIFDMFFRATSASEGSGLGLFIVKEAAEKLNAIISVTSTIGKGSTFTVSFPAA